MYINLSDCYRRAIYQAGFDLICGRNLSNFAKEYVFFKDEDKVITILGVHSETSYFMCGTSKVFKYLVTPCYFVNVILEEVIKTNLDNNYPTCSERKKFKICKIIAPPLFTGAWFDDRL